MSNGGFVGCIAISKCGHDKGCYYVIVKVVDEKFVLLANGENRPLGKPKRKSISHIWVTTRRTAATNDLGIKKAIQNAKRGVNE